MLNKIRKNIKRGSLLKVSLNYFRIKWKRVFSASITPKKELQKIISRFTESKEDAIEFLTNRVMEISNPSQACILITSEDDNSLKIEQLLQPKLELIKLDYENLSSITASKLVNVSCIITSYFSASMIEKIGKSLINNPLLKMYPFEYVCIPKFEYAALEKYDHYNKFSFVSPILTSGINFNEIYNESIPKFGLDTPLFEYTAKCDIRDFMDLNQILDHLERNKLQGDIAEFGSYKGHSGYLMTEVLKRLGSSKTVYLFDTFEEFPNEDIGIDNFWSNTHKVDYDEVVARLSSQEKAILIRGDFTKTLAKSDIKKLCFAYIDCDSYRATEYLTEFIYEDLLTPGGVMVFEDYGHPPLLGNRLAVHNFFDNRRDCFRFFSQFSGYYIVIKLS
jgi:hypothetical protein